MTETNMNDATGGNAYELSLSFDGPWGTHQDERITLASCYNLHDKDLVERLCDSQRQPHAQTCLMRVSVARNVLPENVVGFVPQHVRLVLQTRGDAPVGMYVYNAEQPCVLEYMYVAPAFRNLGFGSHLLRHYESVIAATYPGHYPALWLAAATSSACIGFYQRNGYNIVDVPHAMTSPVPEASEPILGQVTLSDESYVSCSVTVHVHADTTVMRKELPFCHEQPRQVGILLGNTITD